MTTYKDGLKQTAQFENHFECAQPIELSAECQEHFEDREDE